MKYAADFRGIARNALRGRWPVAVLTGFVASLIGAGIASTSGGSSSNSSSRLCPLFQAFVQQNEAVSFPVQALDAVSPPPAEQEQCVGEGVQFILLLDHPGQTVYTFAQVGIAAGNVDLVSPGKVVQHDFKIRSIISTVAVSAPEWISTVAPAM